MYQVKNLLQAYFGPNIKQIKTIYHFSVIFFKYIILLSVLFAVYVFNISIYLLICNVHAFFFLNVLNILFLVLVFLTNARFKVRKKKLPFIFGFFLSEL